MQHERWRRGAVSQSHQSHRPLPGPPEDGTRVSQSCSHPCTAHRSVPAPLTPPRLIRHPASLCSAPGELRACAGGCGRGWPQTCGRNPVRPLWALRGLTPLSAACRDRAPEQAAAVQRVGERCPPATADAVVGDVAPAPERRGRSYLPCAAHPSVQRRSRCEPGCGLSRLYRDLA